MKSGEYSSDAAEIVLVNPKAGSISSQRHRRRWQDLLARDALVICPKSREETEALAARACTDGVPRLIVVGGDGTLHHAVNGLLSVPGTATRFAVIPGGTANDYVASLRQQVRAAKRSSIEVDIGAIRCGDFQRYFLNVAAVGLTAHTAASARPASWLPARLRYTIGLFRTLIDGWRVVPATLQFDNGPELTKIFLTISIAIGQREGSFTLAPSARIDDGRFNILLAGALRRRDVLRYLPGLMVGKLPQKDPRIEYLIANNVAIRPDAAVPWHLDGEVYQFGQLGKGQEMVIRHAGQLDIELIEPRPVPS